MHSRSWIESQQKPARRTTTDGVVGVFLRAVAESFGRARQRRDLAALSDHSLRDLGLSRADVESEIAKPIWRL